MWSTVDGTPLVTGLQGFHTARVKALLWSPDGSTLASAGLDSVVLVWDLEAKKAKHKFTNAHASGGASALAFPDAKVLISCGMDSTIKLWSI